MMNLLARFAESRAKRVLIVAALFFVVAGALGAGVADRLDPYGADDPDTQSVQAQDRLEAAGYRGTGVVVLIEDVDVKSPAGQERVEGIADRVAKDPAVQKVSGYLDTQSPDFISEDGNATYL